MADQSHLEILKHGIEAWNKLILLSQTVEVQTWMERT